MGSLAVQKLGRSSQFDLGYLAGRSFPTRAGHSIPQRKGRCRGALVARTLDGFIIDKFLYSSETAFLGGATPFDASGLNTVAGWRTPVLWCCGIRFFQARVSSLCLGRA